MKFEDGASVRRTVIALQAKLQRPWQDVGINFANGVALGEEDHDSDVHMSDVEDLDDTENKGDDSSE